MPSPRTLLRSARALALKTANVTGLSGAVASSRWRQDRLLVLCYHGVSQADEHEWATLYISPERLAERLDHLKRLNANVLPLDEAVERLYAGTLPPRAVCLTFDDGACDFSIKAVPILTAARMHSTLYLTTYYTRKDMPVFNPFVSYVLWTARGRTVEIPGLPGRHTIPMTTADPEFTQLHARVLEHAKSAGMTTDDKNEYARKIANAVGANFDDLCKRRLFHLMRPDEVRALNPELVSVQLHTHRHLTPSSMEQLREELDRNSAEIVDLTGRNEITSHFCYPSGIYSQDFVTWLDQYGVKSATTCVPHYSTRETPRLEIPRFVDTMAVSADTFEAWITGSAAFTLVGR
ncbi:MAG: polysaccharide deacetylase family protein [Gemmatimonas sp.]